MKRTCRYCPYHYTETFKADEPIYRQDGQTEFIFCFYGGKLKGEYHSIKRSESINSRKAHK